ncbi:MAG TPA: putative DNA-binding domain-containing protein [bacterium]|nr:putative DNA-binding domain-containing protein [bacterium]
MKPADFSDLEQTEKFWAKICFEGAYKPKGRYQVYRELVTERMLDTLKNISPVARSLLSEKEWWVLFWAFLKKAPPKSEILRQLAGEFSAYLKARRHPLAKKYPYLGELLEYEYLEIEMRFAPEDEARTPAGKLRLNPAHALASYRWPVHFISENFRESKKMPRGLYHLLLWRDPQTLEVKFMEVNGLIAALLRRLKRGPQAALTLLKAVAKEQGIAADAGYLAEGRALLQSLREKRILV